MTPSPDISALEIRSTGVIAPVMNANLIAPFYQPVEYMCFGSALQQRRTAFLEDVHGARRAVSCGEGDGRFLVALVKANPGVHATAVDASRRMVELARKRIEYMGDAYRARTDFSYMQVGQFEPGESYDLIATNFFLDCLSTAEVEVVVKQIASWAAPRAKWIVSEFAQPADPVAHLWTGAVIRSLYGAFRLTTGLRVTQLPAYRAAIEGAGFVLRKHECALGGLLVSELWEKI
jgi:ubiquinone/menaquinone biosynthesis C-methylase UbiE